MILSLYSYSTYTSSLGTTFKGFLTISGNSLIFNNKNKIVAKLEKEDISSFKVVHNIFYKYLIIRAKGENYTFRINNKTKTRIINFLKK